MSVNVKQNGDLTKVANNTSIAQANWNDRGNTSKNTCIKNQPATLKSMEEVSANTDENALVGANAVKELSDSLAKYNPETDKLDVYYNGVIVGSLPCRFKTFDILKTSYSDWSLTSDSDSRVTKLDTTINNSSAKFVTTWTVGAMNTYTAYIRYVKESINLTNFNKIRFTASFVGSGTALKFGISLVNKGTNVRTIILTKNTGNAMSISCDENIDISNYSGDYYIEVFTNSSQNPSPTITITSLYLE